MKALTLTPGQTFHRWTVKHRAEKQSKQGVMWVCVCECGREQALAAGRLRAGASKGCFYCWRGKGLDTQAMKAMRARGASHDQISKHFGVSRFTVRRHVGSNGRYSNWMWRNYSKVERLRGEGHSWVEILELTGHPYKREFDICAAYSRERRHRLREKIERGQLVAVHQLTKEGLSASAIAERLGMTERSVQRKRARGVPELDLPRIRSLLGRGVDWRSIWSRLGCPTEDSQVLRVWFEALDVEEAIAA